MELPPTADHFLNDCEGELSLFRNLDVMNKMAEDIKRFSFQEIEDKLTDRELERYIKLIPGPNHSTRKRMIIQWLRENPAMVTLDPNVLYQRFFLYKRQVGSLSRIMNPIQTNPIHETCQRFKTLCHFNNRMVEFLRKERAEANGTQEPAQEQPRALPQPMIFTQAQSPEPVQQAQSPEPVQKPVQQVLPIQVQVGSEIGSEVEIQPPIIKLIVVPANQ